MREATGRTPRLGSDYVSARAADAREATALDLATGTAVLAGARLYSDDQGVIEYGEYVAPPEHVVIYDYDIPTEDLQS